jgi:hypothetical protein
VTVHDHDDDGLHAGCAACVARVKRDQAEARWNDAPKRRVRFLCTFTHYPDPDEVDVAVRAMVEFALPLQVPADADGDEIEDRYPQEIGEAFLIALPDNVKLDDTEIAMTTMVVEQVIVGGLIPDVTAPAEPLAPSLFEALS